MCVHRVVHKSALQTRQLICKIGLVLFVVTETALMIVWPVDLPTQTDEVASAAMRVSAKDAIFSSSRREEVEEASFALTAVKEGPADEDYSTVRSWLAKVACPKLLQGAHVYNSRKGTICWHDTAIYVFAFEVAVIYVFGLA